MSDVIQRMVMAASIMPAAEELRQFSEDMPSAAMRAEKRLPALRKLADAAARFVEAYHHLNEAAAQEADPDRDRAAQAEVESFARRMGGPHV